MLTGNIPILTRLASSGAYSSTINDDDEFEKSRYTRDDIEEVGVS